ncbi:MAG TPA: GWxTD domain-containing protein [Thermoanaerobaculia bacterium]
MHKALGLLLSLLFAIPTMAALSPKLQEWGDGPAQWLMTPEEQRAWRNVATDSDAVNFIDLFWARRDPTPGTAVNEYRGAFNSRVEYADESFTEDRKRGAMTDRGRVYIVLGRPSNMGGLVGQSLTQMGASDADAAKFANRRSSTRHQWIWEREDARQFDMARIEVVFNEDPATHRTQREPRKADFGRANPTAIRKAIVNPDLTEVPKWAAFGGLEPKAPVTEAEVHFPAPAAPSAPAEEDVELPAVASDTTGVSRLTFLPGGALNARSETDPFAVVSESTFKTGRDVLWGAQYCSATAETPKLNYMLLIAGPLDGKSTDQRTRLKEAKPERMMARPGCYVLQGMVPVSKLAAGRYKVTVMIDDSVTGEVYNIKGEFRTTD